MTRAARPAPRQLELVRAMIARNPNVTAREIVAATGVSIGVAIAELEARR